MNTLKLRPVFSSQYSQSLVVDVSDIDKQFLNNIAKALQNVLTLACSVRGAVRIPAFGLSALTKGITELYELNSIRGNFNKIIAALDSLQTYVKINENIELQDYKDGLYMMISSIIRTFNKNRANFDTQSNVEITLITMKGCKLVRSYIEEFIKDMEVTHIYKITIIQLEWQAQYIKENKRTEQTAFIQTIIMNGNVHIELENYFKNWLMDLSSDIKAILHFPGSEAMHMSIKCDILECILNPLSLPFGHRFYIRMDSLSVQFTGSTIPKTAASNIPVYELNIIARVSSSSICESSLFGLPLCIRPTKSWSLSLEVQHQNEQLFFELCNQLVAGEQVLLAQMRGHFQTDQFLPYFILIPGDCCLLMKTFATSDLTLPWKQKSPSASKSAENSAKIFSNLQNLKLLDSLEPEEFENGLLTVLTANLKHASKRDNYGDFGPDPNFLKKAKRHK